MKPYHFVEIPPGKPVQESLEENKVKKSADSFISHSELLSSKFSRNQRMLALQHTIHIIGDVHQPLHVGNRIDIGANLCTVKWTDPENGRAYDVNLHSVWDDKIFDVAKRNFNTAKPDPSNKMYFYDYVEVATCVLNYYESLPADEKEKTKQLGEDPHAKWYEQSQAPLISKKFPP